MGGPGSGRRPAPTSLKLLRGGRKDRINTDEPSAPAGHPELPDGVSDEVRAVWDYTLAQLDLMQVASTADRDALLAYCEAVVTHRRASRLLARSNVLVPGAARTTAVRNPAVQIQRDAAATIRAYAREFGLTPSGRASVRIGRGDDGLGPDRLLT